MAAVEPSFVGERRANDRCGVGAAPERESSYHPCLTFLKLRARPGTSLNPT
jgi:hypothetical protein